uniref:Uncharacterized protein n=1 Tax=Ananas comosus var. bracteatus TaxID=296719 RepID=A0A6V7NFP0_ANACO|nr:unnamed protein product [Ananas comosus var. bracteatus]
MGRIGGDLRRSEAYQDPVGEAHEHGGDEGVRGELGGADVADERLGDHRHPERREPRADRRPRHHPQLLVLLHQLPLDPFLLLLPSATSSSSFASGAGAGASVAGRSNPSSSLRSFSLKSLSIAPQSLSLTSLSLTLSLVREVRDASKRGVMGFLYGGAGMLNDGNGLAVPTTAGKTQGAKWGFNKQRWDWVSPEIDVSMGVQNFQIFIIK